MAPSSGWSERALDDLAHVNPENLGETTPPGFQFRYIDLSSVCRGGIDWSLVQPLQFLRAPSRARRVARTGDVLFGTVRPALQSHAALREFTSGPLVASTGFAVLRARPEVGDSSFLAHYCLGSQATAEARRMEVGSSYPAVNESDVRRFRVNTPPLSEQRQIATILDTIDDVILKTEQIIAKLKQVKQGLLHDLLTRGIDDNGELRDPERHPEQFKESPLGRIPRGWEVKLLGSLLEAIQQGWSPDCASTPAARGEWGVLKTTAVQWGGFSFDANKALPSHLAPRPDIEVHEGDVLMTRAGPASRVGVVSFVDRTQPKLMLSDKLYRLVPSAALHPRFLALALSGKLSQRHLSSMKAGLAETQENISHAIVRALRLLSPPPEEQRLIAAQAARCDERDVQEAALLAKLLLLKAGLMEDLLTGRVRVTRLLESTAE